MTQQVLLQLHQYSHSLKLKKKDELASIFIQRKIIKRNPYKNKCVITCDHMCDLKCGHICDLMCDFLLEV